MGVRHSVSRVLVQGLSPVVIGVLIKEREQRPHVLQPRVHALPVERHHGVRGVAQQHDGRGEVVRLALDADERQVRVALEAGDEVPRRDQRRDAGEVGVEEGRDAGRVGLEARVLLAGREERAREGAVLAGDGDEHELLARPDVQVVRADAELRHGVGGVEVPPRLDLELAPQRVDVPLLVVHARVLHHVVPHGRVRAIRAQHQVEGDLDLPRPAVVAPVFDLEPGLALPEVRACELVVEEELHVGHALEHVEDALVQAAAVDGEDCLGTLAQDSPHGNCFVALTRPWTS